MTEATPQDRKPKATKADGAHAFTVAGKTYTLPPISETAASQIPGDVTYAAIMEPENDFAQMRLSLASLEAAKPSAAAMKALKSLSTDKMLEVVYAWMGESRGSSD